MEQNPKYHLTCLARALASQLGAQLAQAHTSICPQHTGTAWNGPWEAEGLSEEEGRDPHRPSAVSECCVTLGILERRLPKPWQRQGMTVATGTPPLRFLTSGHGSLALRASVRINQTPPVKQGPPPYRTVVAMH